MQLELRHYRAFLALRDFRTTIAAAGHLGVSQSAISHQLSEAEKRIGRKLFNRSGRTLHLTTGGEMIAVAAEKMLKEARKLEKTLVPEQLEVETTALHVGTFSSNSYRWLPKFFRHFASKDPSVVFEFANTGVGFPIDLVENGDIDFGIVGGKIIQDSVASVELFKDELVCVVPKSSHLGERPFVVAEDLANETYIVSSKSDEEGIEGKKFWRPAGIQPVKQLNAGNAETAVELVSSGFGFAILSKWVAESSLETSEVVCVPLTEKGIFIKWYSVFLKTHNDFDRIKKISLALRKWCKDSEFPS